MKKIIIFLIRWKLGIKRNQYFKFENQKSEDLYQLSEYGLIKTVVKNGKDIKRTLSTVSLNWLLSSECKIKQLNQQYIANNILR